MRRHRALLLGAATLLAGPLLALAGAGPATADEHDGCLPAGNGMVIVGGVGNDNLVGTPFDDLIFGLDGDDTIDGMGGNDVIHGGEGDDLIDGDTPPQPGAPPVPPRPAATCVGGGGTEAAVNSEPGASIEQQL